MSSRTIDRVAQVLASMITAAIVVIAMVAADAPTWAWVGLGLTVYLLEIQFPAKRRTWR